MLAEQWLQQCIRGFPVHLHRVDMNSAVLSQQPTTSCFFKFFLALLNSHLVSLVALYVLQLFAPCSELSSVGSPHLPLRASLV